MIEIEHLMTATKQTKVVDPMTIRLPIQLKEIKWPCKKDKGKFNVEVSQTKQNHIWMHLNEESSSSSSFSIIAKLPFARDLLKKVISCYLLCTCSSQRYLNTITSSTTKTTLYHDKLRIQHNTITNHNLWSMSGWSAAFKDENLKIQKSSILNHCVCGEKIKTQGFNTNRVMS